MATVPSRTPASVPARSGPPLRPVDRATRVLRAVLLAGVVVSIIHYTDNTVRYDDYTGGKPNIIARWMIPVSWVAFTALAVVAYRWFRQGAWPKAAGAIGAYSASGLISVFHFTTVSPSDFDGFQNTFVVLDVVCGIAALAFAVWAARSHSLDRTATPAP